MNYLNITIEAECGATYNKPGFAIYGHRLTSESSATYTHPGQTYRCWLEGDFATPEIALQAAYAMFPDAPKWAFSAVAGTTFQPYNPPTTPPAWFDAEAAGETW